jgi:hypothetical protein
MGQVRKRGGDVVRIAPKNWERNIRAIEKAIEQLTAMANRAPTDAQLREVGWQCRLITRRLQRLLRKRNDAKTE